MNYPVQNLKFLVILPVILLSKYKHFADIHNLATNYLSGKITH